MTGVLLLATLLADSDPRAILERVDAAAKSFTTRQITMQMGIDTKGTGLQQHLDIEVIAATSDGGKFRIEVRNGISPMLTVSDGETGWVYFPALKKYSKLAGEQLKTVPGNYAGTNVAQNLVSARLVREETLDIAGEPAPCYVIQADYEKSGSKSSRELWIDKSRDLVLREESKSSAELPGNTEKIESAIKMKVTSLKLNVFIPDEEFRFTPPEGVALAPGLIPGPPLPPGAAGAHRIGNGVTAPTLTYKVEPEFSEEARRAKIEGAVVLYVVVGADGRPRDMRVLRGLGHGLDENAIAAVAQWRFNPGHKGGKPVAVAATVEVNFRFMNGTSVLQRTVSAKP